MCIISSSYVNSNWSYSPETVKLGFDLCDLNLWPWPFAWTLLWSLVITPENFMMIRWWEHSEKGGTDGQTDGQTDNTICRAAWSQLKTYRLKTNRFASQVTQLRYSNWTHSCSWCPSWQLHPAVAPVCICSTCIFLVQLDQLVQPKFPATQLAALWLLLAAWDQSINTVTTLVATWHLHRGFLFNKRQVVLLLSLPKP